MYDKGEDTRKARCREVWIKAGSVAIVGGIYAIICTYTDFRIPCVFHKITGFYCPGCGITRMCIALLHLDIKKAWSYNPLLMIVLPILIVLIGKIERRYIAVGSRKMKPMEKAITYILLAVLVIFGIVRNVL